MFNWQYVNCCKKFLDILIEVNVNNRAVYGEMYYEIKL